MSGASWGPIERKDDDGDQPVGSVQGMCGEGNASLAEACGLA